MQKKVLAAVIGGLLAAPAAFADVTISGRLAVGVESYKVDAPLFHNEQRVSDQSSSLVFSGSEDLGDGMKAWFQIDNRLAPDTGTFAASGNTLVGLAGGWGKLGIGRSDLHYNELNAIGGLGASGSLQSFLGDGIMSQVTGDPLSIAGGTRTPNVVMWDSPAMGGITARVAYSTNAAVAVAGPNEGSGLNNGSKGSALNAALRWSGGPLLAGVSYWNSDTEGANTGVYTQKSNREWVGWSAGAIKVGLGFDTSKVNIAAGTELKRNAYLIPVTFTTGAETLVASYAVAKDESGTSNTGAKAYNIGLDHALSKRTHVGAYYTALKNDPGATYQLFAIAASGATAAPAGGDPKQIYLGIAHFY